MLSYLTNLVTTTLLSQTIQACAYGRTLIVELTVHEGDGYPKLDPQSFGCPIIITKAELVIVLSHAAKVAVVAVER